MEIILQQDVPNLGYKHDVVNVKPGYARNFLIPKGLAIEATESAKKMNVEIVKQKQHKEEKLRKEAQDTATKLSTTIVKVFTKAGESGKIFGSVTTIQIAQALQEQGFNIDRKSIILAEEQIKTLGTYKAKIKVYKDISTEITFEVAEEK
ncbi:MAG TPA: 50S ribosomal protein L9 [Bacteroidia bacterium]|nr:50S ribosomal protein L9 [Bacteroidia bacterium]